MQIKQILLLAKQSISNRQIAERLQISRNTVNTYIRFFKSTGQDWTDLLSLTDEELDEMFKKEETPSLRLNQLLNYFPEVLNQTSVVGFTYQKMWEEYKNQFEDGYGYSQFMEHYHRWNAKHEATLKLTHIAGEALMVDYAGDKLRWVDKTTAEVIDVEVFVAVLPASGYIYVQATPSQKKEDFIRCMTNCLNYLGGVPQMIIPDNLKSAVSKSSKYEAIANRSLRDLGLHYGAVLNPTRPYKAKDKALVERAVRLVYERIYFPMRNETFFSLHELNVRIAELLNELNERKLSGRDCSRKDLYLETELPKLKPLPSHTYQLKEYKRAKVQKNCHVYLSVDKHYYSVPYRFISKYTMIHYTDRMVEVYHNHQRIATHLRERISSGYTTKKEHLPSSHQFYLNWSPQFFLDKARPIGPCTVEYIQRLFDQDGPAEPKYKTALGIVQLQKKYDRGRINRACQIALLHPVSSYQRVLGILEKDIDLEYNLFETPPSQGSSHIPDHENIRGAEYFSSLLNQNNNHASDN